MTPRLIWSRCRNGPAFASIASIRGGLRGYGLKVGEVSRGRFEARIRELTAGHATLETVIGAMLVARMALWSEFTKLHREMLKIARADKVCRRLMSTPSVGAALVALTYRSAVDDPTRFGKSSTVGAYFGLTPKKYPLTGPEHIVASAAADLTDEVTVVARPADDLLERDCVPDKSGNCCMGVPTP